MNGAKHLMQSLRKFWDREDSLSVFLSLLVLFIFIIAPMSHLSPRAHILVEITLGVVLFSGIWATFDSPLVVSFGSWLVLFALVSTFTKYLLAPSDSLALLSELSDFLAIGMLSFVVLRQTLKSGPITTHRIKGAIAGYLLLGVLWAKLYCVLYLVSPASFSGVSPEHPLVSLVYFSFVTLTTVGYGDILPTHVISRSLANAEALIGQLFPAIFIARLVGLEIEHRKHVQSD